MVSPADALYAQKDMVRSYLQESARIKLLVADECLDSILTGAQMLIDAFQSGNKVLLCGNGGSAADCQHVAAELVSRLTQEIERPGLPAISLTTDTSFLTAYSNDEEFEGVFERQISALGKPGDVLVAISTSGNSKNVIRAVKQARSMGITTMALTSNRGSLKDLTDVCVLVPSDNTQHIQESHLAVEHLLCYLVERTMFGQESTRENNR